MAYQWGEPIRAGQWYCRTHGPITPDESGVVPACPDCGTMAMLGVKHQGLVVVEVPGPKQCPRGHDLTGQGSAKLGHRPCGCRPEVRGHATWTCAQCGEETIFPPCSR